MLYVECVDYTYVYVYLFASISTVCMPNFITNSLIVAINNFVFVQLQSKADCRHLVDA